jgi:protein-tyrosine phosphatase
VTDISALLQCAPNFRAVDARIARPDGSIVPVRLFRSDAVLAPLEADRAMVAQCGIGLVFDLRSATERTNHPNRFWLSQGIEVFALDMLARIEGGGDPWVRMRTGADVQGARSAMLAVYGAFPAAVHGQLRSAVEAIVQSPGAVLIHCTAGKDRTGFLVALLLSAVGVPRETVIADYLRSAGRTNAAARDATRALASSRLGVPLPEDSLDELMSVQEAFLAASFAAIDRNHGSLDAYLESTGVTSIHRARLESALLG